MESKNRDAQCSSAKAESILVWRDCNPVIRTSGIRCCSLITFLFALFLFFVVSTVHARELVNNLHFPGHYYDEETGLYYNRHRFYDPEIGRYLTSDPIGLSAGLNTYSYALQNPLKFFDPLGLYIPKVWPENCLMVVADDDSHSYTKEIVGDPFVYDRRIIFAGIPIRRKKGDSLVIGFIARLFWEQVTMNFQFDVIDIEYYLECIEYDECGNEVVSRDFSSHYDVKEERLRDTIHRWREIVFSDSDVPVLRRR